MTLTVTKKRKWKVLLCNLHAGLHVSVLDLMTSWHSVRFSVVVVSKGRLAVSFPDKTNLVSTKCAQQSQPDKLIIAKTMSTTKRSATSSRNISFQGV